MSDAEERREAADNSLGHPWFEGEREPTQLRFQCCFCGKETCEGFQVVAMFELEGEELSQTWWAHRACFEVALHSRAQVFSWYETEWEDEDVVHTPPA